MLIIIRIFFAFLISAFCFVFSCSAVSEPSLSASSAVVIDGETGDIIFEKNAHQSRSMASTTKIMTTLLAVESGKLNDVIKIKSPPLIEGTAVGFKSGDTVTLETLCYGMILESGNDAALLTAEFLAGSEADFSLLMNKKASEIGMKNTNFVTASGLDDESHYTTAYDMALLGAYAVKNEKFAEICSTKNYKAHFITPDITSTFYNHNRLLGSCDGVFGIKTGFTKKSGRCLVTACKRDNKILVAVTLNAPDDWNDHKKLYEYGYSLYNKVSPDVSLPQRVNVYGSEKDFFRIKIPYVQLTVKDNSEVTYKVYLPGILYAPIKENDIIGKVDFYNNKKFVCTVPILSDESVITYSDAIEYKPSLFQRFIDYIN